MASTILGMSFIERYARLLFVVPLLVVFTLLLILVIVVSVRMWIRTVRLRRAKRLDQMEYLDDHGVPYPPAGRGMCNHCHGAFNKVHFLADGRRLCPECYDLAGIGDNTEFAETSNRTVPDGKQEISKEPT